MRAGKAVASLIAVTSIGGGGVLLTYRLMGAAVGPEAALISRLRRTETLGLTLEVPGARTPLVSKAHHFDRFSVHLDSQSAMAHVVCTLDFTGRLGTTEVSSVGLERIEFQYRAGEWTPLAGLAPRLTQVVAALEARRQSLESGDASRAAHLMSSQTKPGAPEAGALRQVLSLSARTYQARGWFIRLERDEAVATEEYHLSGELDGRAIDEKASRRLTLKRKGNEFLFSEGIL